MTVSKPSNFGVDFSKEEMHSLYSAKEVLYDIVEDMREMNLDNLEKEEEGVVFSICKIREMAEDIDYFLLNLPDIAY